MFFTVSVLISLSNEKRWPWELPWWSSQFCGSRCGLRRRSLVTSAARAGVSAVAISSEFAKAPAKDFVLIQFSLRSLPSAARLSVHFCVAPTSPSPRAGEGRVGGAIADRTGRCFAFRYRLNQYSNEAFDVFLSSGDSDMMAGDCREPARTAMYCLPFTE